MFVGHPLQAEGLPAFIVSSFPRGEAAAWRQRLEDDQSCDFCVATRTERGWQACLFAQDLGGNATLIWPPAGNAPEVDWSPLGERLFAELRLRNVRYTQSLLAPENEVSIARLQSLGMNRLTTMDYMVASVDDPARFDRETTDGDQFRMQHLLENDESRICRVVDGTYQHTLDCPELDGIRSVEDVVRGYREAAPVQMWIVQPLGEQKRALGEQEGAGEQEGLEGTQDAGILILSDHPDHRQTELTYMGLLPAHRGRGWGRALVQFAIHKAKEMDRDKIVLAVDRRNTPAVEQYRRLSFRTWTSRVCLTRNL